jgi:hypothetical protein
MAATNLELKNVTGHVEEFGRRLERNQLTGGFSVKIRVRYEPCDGQSSFFGLQQPVSQGEADETIIILARWLVVDIQGLHFEAQL